MDNRHFLVSYNGEDGLMGTCEFTTESGRYLNRELVYKHLRGVLKTSNKLDCILIITNITELSKEDYKDWIKRE